MTDRIVVVGGGLVGTATAYYAAREGLSVTLLEQEAIGYGASGRNPGFVWLHCRNPGWALEVSLAGRRLYDELLRDLPEPFEFRAEGGLIYFLTPEQGRVFEEFVGHRREDGLDMELIDGAEVRRLVGPIRPDVLGASFCANDAQINTPTVVAALAAGARAERADVREGVTMTALARAGDRVVGVETTAGRFEADMVVIATGAWTQRLLAADDVAVPVGMERLQVLATVPRPLDILPVVYGPLAAKQYTLFSDLPSWNEADFLAPYEIESGRWMLQLVSQRANGETLLGCPMDYPAEVTHEVTLSGLRDTATAIGDDFPGLRDVGIDRAWAGVLPYTSDLVPIVDEVTPGLFVAAGHVFGNAAGPMTGKLVAQLLLGKEADIDMTECRWGRDLEAIAPGASVHW
ncbi:MAG TPA: FAD-dependent oxidoreductase [Acidimicrobiales bacterium]|nr:FAD-dependent oxidoreductase [Acidimicrobiales bacterium]